MIQEVDKPRFRSSSPAFNEPTNSGPAIPLSSDTQYAAAFDLESYTIKILNENGLVCRCCYGIGVSELVCWCGYGIVHRVLYITPR